MKSFCFDDIKDYIEPKKRTAKIMRRVIRAAYLGENAGDLSALENPKIVEEIQQLGV